MTILNPHEIEEPKDTQEELFSTADERLLFENRSNTMPLEPKIHIVEQKLELNLKPSSPINASREVTLNMVESPKKSVKLLSVDARQLMTQTVSEAESVSKKDEESRLKEGVRSMHKRLG